MTQKARKEAILRGIVVIFSVALMGYYAFTMLPDIFTKAKYERNADSFVTKSLNTTAEEYRTISLKKYSRSEVIDYFMEIASQTESISDTPCWTFIHKRITPVKYYICGTVTDEDLQVLNHLADQIVLVPGAPHISRTENESDASTIIHFHYAKEMPPCGLRGLPERYGGVFVFPDDNDPILDKTTIQINASATQSHRSSVIQEEMIQSLGLQNDSYRYPDSLFYQGYVDVDPSDIDWLLLEILYHPVIRPGSSRCETLFTLRNVLFPLY